MFRSDFDKFNESFGGFFAVRGRGNRCGDFANFVIGRLRNAQSIGDVDFGDVLSDALTFDALSTDGGEYNQVAIAVLNLRAIEVDSEINTGVGAHLTN